MEPLTFEQLHPYQSKIRDLINYLDNYDHDDLGDKLTIIFDNEPWLLDTTIEPFETLVNMAKVLGLKTPGLTFEQFKDHIMTVLEDIIVFSFIESWVDTEATVAHISNYGKRPVQRKRFYEGFK